MKNYISYETTNLIEVIERLIADKYYITLEHKEGEKPVTREQALWELRKGGTMHRLVNTELKKLTNSILTSNEYSETSRLAINKDEVMIPLFTQYHENRISDLYLLYAAKRLEDGQTETSKALFIKSLKKHGIYYSITADKILGETK